MVTQYRVFAEVRYLHRRISTQWSTGLTFARDRRTSFESHLPDHECLVLTNPMLVRKSRLNQTMSLMTHLVTDTRLSYTLFTNIKTYIYMIFRTLSSQVFKSKPTEFVHKYCKKHE